MMETTWKYKPYPEYKESGVKWLGQIPSNWGVYKLKLISSVQTSNVDKKTIDGEQKIQLCNYTDVYHNNEISSDIEFMRASATIEQIVKFRLSAEDVIITKDSESWSDIAVPAYVPHDFDDVICGYHLAQIKSDKTKVCGKYLYYSFLTSGINEQFQVSANGITRYGLGKYWIDNSLFYVPSLKEQQAIASFLDRETARIDELIAKKEQLISLLEEKRTALISHAVTKGLNPDAKMKDSGIEWLGEIPEHWEVKRLKHISPQQSVGLVINPSTYVDDDGDVPFLFGGDISENHISYENARRITKESNLKLKPSMLFFGDLVTVRVGYPGVTAVVTDYLNGCNCASMMIIRKSKKFNSLWLCYAINSKLGKYQIEVVQYGAAQKQFNISHAVEFVFPVPPFSEQVEIASYLEKADISVKNLMKKNYSVIEKLQEYRTALISAAVTGKIDVRNEVN